MLYEIRNYHFKKELFEDYKKWIGSGPLSYLKKHLDVVGFWISTDIPAEIFGKRIGELDAANITWIIRWRDMKQREIIIPKVLECPQWEDLFATVPGGEDSYHRVELKFMNML